MVGVSRVLRGETITCLVGNPDLTEVQEKELRRGYVKRALEILETEVDSPTVFTLEGTA